MRREIVVVLTAILLLVPPLGKIIPKENETNFNLTARKHNLDIQKLPNPFPLKKSSYPTKESKLLGGKTIYVPDDYPTIQEAIDHADVGDTIKVRAGIYYENIKVYKKLNIVGSGSSVTIIDGGGKGSVVTIATHGVKFTDFTVRNGDIGIKIGYCYPTSIFYSVGNMINGNNIINNKLYGIWLYGSCNTVTKNNFINNGDGIFLWEYSWCNRITRNNIINSRRGLWLIASLGNIITKNNITNNQFFGIGSGILLDYSSGNKITKNNFMNNDYGIMLLDSFGNRIARNNFIGNHVQATFDCSHFNWWFNNYWDDWKSRLPRPIKGTTHIPFTYKYIPWINFDWRPSIEPWGIRPFTFI